MGCLAATARQTVSSGLSPATFTIVAGSKEVSAGRVQVEGPVTTGSKVLSQTRHFDRSFGKDSIFAFASWQKSLSAQKSICLSIRLLAIFESLPLLSDFHEVGR